MMVFLGVGWRVKLIEGKLGVLDRVNCTFIALKELKLQ
jgi:hypothetical protein